METIMPELNRLLVECASRDLPVAASRLSDLPPERWQDLLSLAESQRVCPLLWQRLREKGLEHTVPTPVAEELRDASRRNALSNLCLYAELRQLLSALESESIPLILLKGIYLAEAVYGSIGLREMNDIDVLARPGDITRISEILERMGYVPLQPAGADITLKAQHHLPRMVKAGRAGFEIHWNLTLPGEKYSIDPEELWERAVPVRIAGAAALSLAPEDLLLHLCLHTSFHHQFAFGLRPSCDIAEVVAHFGPALDWDGMAERAFRWGWQRGVYLALLLARELAGAHVPVSVLEMLRPADMSEGVHTAAREQIFGDKNVAASLSPAFAAFLESGRLYDRVCLFWQRLFQPRRVIAFRYSVPSDSMKILACYPRHLVDMIRRHGNILKKHRQNDASLRCLAERTNRIAGWLDR